MQVSNLVFYAQSTITVITGRIAMQADSEMCVCVRACVRACVRECVRACVCVSGRARGSLFFGLEK